MTSAISSHLDYLVSVTHTVAMQDRTQTDSHLGVAVGKFNPPHLGHLHLLTTAAAQVDHLMVLLCDRPDQTIAASTRATWLADACPDNVEIVITPDDIPAANEQWAARALELLPRAPDVAFTSEPWGQEWAALMGARHVAVDIDRTTVPTCGTDLRNDLGANFHRLVPAARAALARRVVVAGAESTGKTTLAQQLAEALGTAWVPEQGRTYWEGRRHLTDQSWASDEFRRIATAQRLLEHDLSRQAARGVVVSDTDALVTAVWHQRYLGHADPALDTLCDKAAPNLYLVCAPDFDWVQDGTRESAQQRAAMHADTLARAVVSGAAVEILTGAPEARLLSALAVIEPFTRFPTLV